MNPALPGGAPGDTQGGSDGSWLVSGRLSYAGVPYKSLQQGTKEAPNPDELQVNVHLITAELAVTAPWQTKLSVQLPTGRLATSTLAESRTDTDIGDAELRIRQSLPRFSSLRLDIGAGLVLPTGPYIAKSGAANLPPEASFLTLGRGVTWAIGELQLSTSVTKNISAYGEIAARAPLGRAEDDFDWGSEVRGLIGGQARLPHGIAALAIAEWQWRGTASEPDPFAGGRLESANAGGNWFTLMPGLGYDLSKNISIVGGARVLVYSDVNGNQLVPSLGGFLSLTGRWSPKPANRQSPPKEATSVPEPVIGSITIIDYWATWCAPCKDIDALLSAAAGEWGDDVVIHKVDASASPDESVTLPAEATGLPVVEIYDATGTRTEILLGPDALRVVNIVNRMREKAAAGP